MKNPKLHSGHRQRLRNRVKKYGLQDFEEHQILEYLLTYSIPRKDTNELAHNLINSFGSLKNVLDAKPEFLQQVQGIGENSALLLSSLPAIFNVYTKPSKYPSLKTFGSAVKFCKEFMKDKPIEELYVICLDSKYKITNVVKACSGDINSASVSVREITEIAIKNNATFVIFTHNHPSSQATPSENDDAFTKNIFQFLSKCGITVSDHIIIGKESFFSYASSDKNFFNM